MSTVTLTFEHIEGLIKADDYRTALSLLQEAFREGSIASGSIDMLKYQLLLSNCYYKLGEFEEAQEEVKPAFVLGKSLSDDFLFAEAKYLSGSINIAIGNTETASEEFNEAYVFYKRSEDHENVVHSLSMLARCYFLKGQLQRSKEYLIKAIDAAVENRMDSKHIVGLKNNLCKAALRLGDHSLAQQQIEELKQFELSTALTVHLRFVQILLSLQSFDFSLADQLLQDVQPLLAELDLPIYEIIYNEYHGLLEYNTGNYTQAREYYQQVLDMPEPTASAVAQTLRMLTDVCIAERNFDEAMATAKKAEKAITKINERIELGALYRAYGQIYTPRKKYNIARDYFDKSIALLREIGARYELALTYFACGESKSYDDKTRKRYLESARLLFDEMGVPKRVEQVDQAIAQLIDLPRHIPSIRINRTDRNSPVIVTKNPEMLQILSAIDRVKNTDMTILLTGETGTGKDLCAEYIHRTSTRSDGPFQVVNCAAIPEALLESELFGCKRGTYTGATRSKTGLIKSANGGTFYFDEIGEAPLGVQTKLLRVIDTKKVRRLGDTSDVEVDVRFVAATNYNLAERVEAGLFRSDLYYRLSQMPLHLPALRDRKGDIELLVRFFLTEAGVVVPSDDDQKLHELVISFCGHDWRGNVRELKSIVERLTALASKKKVGEIAKVFEQEKSNIQFDSGDSYYRKKLEATFKRNKGNQAKTAKDLGLPVSTLRYQLKKYNIN